MYANQVKKTSTSGLVERGKSPFQEEMEKTKRKQNVKISGKRLAFLTS
jgi:hypothetical protein